MTSATWNCPYKIPYMQYDHNLFLSQATANKNNQKTTQINLQITQLK